MNFSSDVTLHVFLVTFGVLFIASAIGFFLAGRATTESGRATVANLNARTKSWWVMVLVLFGALALGSTGTVLVFALISFLALREFITATPTRRSDHIALFTAFFIVLPCQFWLVYAGWYGMFTILIPVYTFVLIPMLTVTQGDATDFLQRTARTQWGLMVCVYFISHIPMLVTLPVQPLRMGSAGLVLYLVAVTQGSDVFQYVWGKLCGKRPIAPRISPKKTLEGLLGGVLTASLLGAGMFRLTPFTPLQSFGVALLLSLTGFFGGLIMSAIKRERGIKDWGTLIEGHGGMLDRMDSLCFSAPVYFHVLRYFFTP
ncbi:MAG: phosphatidate cytidylyltransferase [Verrucomicrobiaceae bacterium]|nr:phosphatidate cytidylyltransferase [Verrucomicrobiaceae bacterium]